MTCLFALVGFFFPRFLIILLAIFSDYLGRAYSPTTLYPLFPILGFIFLPATTLAVAVAFNSNGRAFSGWEVALIVLAVLIDLGVIGSGSSSNSRRRARPAKKD